METGSSDIYTLLEGCISHMISLTSLVDSCRSAVVCTTFCSAAQLWVDPVVVVHPVEYSSNKELFFRLCKLILIDVGNMRFSLDKSSGAKCYTMSARQPVIIWGDIPKYWRWHPLSDSRSVTSISVSEPDGQIE